MIKLYNSLSKQIEEFKPIKPGHVGLYTCGPTVYDYPHIGNIRSFIFSDLLHRALLARDLKVNFVMNITDVDDKTIKRSQTENKPLIEVTEFYTRIFMEDLERSNILVPNSTPKATEEIPAMVDLIKILLEKDIAYKTSTGDIYFNIAKFPDYGQLARIDLSNLKQNADGRLSKTDEYEKEDARDFALWKAYEESDGDVFWDNELGKGRPGWHIECSAMSAKHLGQPFDIHVGGVDLIFPHHSNEIAQSQAAFGKPLANYWLHTEHLLIENSKMSKSKGNFFTSKDILDKGFDLLTFRYLTLTAHYRSKLNFSWDSLTGAQNALNNLYQEISGFDEATTVIPEFKMAFDQAIENDLDTPKALAVMWDMIKSDNDSGAKMATLLDFDKVLGLKIKDTWTEAKNIPTAVTELVTQREVARKNKDFELSDKLRIEIEAQGYIIEDNSEDVKIKKKF